RISRALSVATLTGVMPTSDDFEHALQIVAQPSQGLFDSFEDYQADFLHTAHEVSVLNELAGDQLSTEQKALRAMEDQLKTSQEWYQAEMERLDEMLEMERQRLEIEMGTYETVLTIPQAIDRVTAAIAAMSAVRQATGGGVPAGWDAGQYLAKNPDLAAYYAANAGDRSGLSLSEWAKVHY